MDPAALHYWACQPRGVRELDTATLPPAGGCSYKRLAAVLYHGTKLLGSDAARSRNRARTAGAVPPIRQLPWGGLAVFEDCRRTAGRSTSVPGTRRRTHESRDRTVRWPLADVRLLSTAVLACSRSGRASTRFGDFSCAISALAFGDGLLHRRRQPGASRKRTTRATPINCVRATGFVPFGFNPVIAATAAIKTAIVSHVSHVMDRILAVLAAGGPSGRTRATGARRSVRLPRARGPARRPRSSTASASAPRAPRSPLLRPPADP